MKFNLYLFFMLPTTLLLGQAGHLMQGVGASNMSMGGAATAQPLDISGAIQWNPAGLSTFDQKIVKLDVGLFYSSPELNSTVPEFDNTGQPTGNFYSGTTKDDKGASPLPALAMVFGNESSKSTFGVSAFGVSGFGVTFPENPTNPINAPQSQGGFGRIESNYMLMQVSFSWAYELSDEFSIGVQPNIDYASLKLMPNPTANPSAAGYPSTDATSSFGFGGQVGIYYHNAAGFKAGASYKSPQFFSDFDFDNTYLDNSTGTNTFNMGFPSIISGGLGYSNDMLDLAVDYRFVNYESTKGFDKTGWTSTASVQGFGWNNMSILSAGVQFKGINKLPLRVGYTYSSNPIPNEVAFFNVPATAIIKNAVQFGLSYSLNDKVKIDGMYHHGMSKGHTTGQLLNPAFMSGYPPYGAIPGSEVSYSMTTDFVMLGVSYAF